MLPVGVLHSSFLLSRENGGIRQSNEYPSSRSKRNVPLQIKIIIEAFKNTYTIKKLFEMTTLYANFGTLKPDLDIPSDPEDHILEEISSSKIDPLCGSRTKIIKENERNFLNNYILNNDTIHSELEKHKPIIDPGKEAEKSKEINTT